MTKMDMVWIAVAKILYPNTAVNMTVSKAQIDDKVSKLFDKTISPVMIQKHLVNSEDRMADKNNVQRGGSRNRYLVRTNDAYRLYKREDASTDAWDKTGPCHPNRKKIDEKYHCLLDWHEKNYYESVPKTV